MKRHGWHFYWLMLAAGLPASVAAQTLAGDGLKGEYYDGRDFERRVLTRRDQAIDFNWRQGFPATGVPADNFSARWTGWLRPPATGRYVLHLTVDDGARLWLGGRQLLDEWRGQAMTTFQVTVDLKAGEAYPLRLDYCQYRWDTRVLLTWELPPKTPAPRSWRNGWGLATAASTPEVISTRYLFSTNPKPAATPLVVAASPAPRSVVPPMPVQPTAVPRRPPARATVRPRPVPARPVARAPAAAPRPDSVPASAGARLAAGQALTLRALYFEQGKAVLPLAAQASLDSVAAALRQRPSLHLEVQGHTDNQGDATLNQQLSQQRAEAVCQYLSAHGVLAAQLRPVGYGGTRPIADNTLPAQRPRNRRVVLQPLP